MKDKNLDELREKILAIQRKGNLLKQVENELSELEKTLDTYFSQTKKKLEEISNDEGKIE